MNADLAPSPAALSAALAAHSAGDWALAQQIYADLLADDPQNAEVMHLLGVLRFQEGDLAAAHGLFERALLLCPKYPPLLRRWGAVLLGSGRIAEAAAAFRAALELEPDEPQTLFNLGLCQRYLGDFESAVSLISDAATGLEEQTLVQYELGLAFHLAGHCDRAARAYRNVLERQPGHADALNNLGVLLFGGGDIVGAAAAYRQALMHRPGFASALNNLSSALMDLGDIEGAARAIRESLEIDQDRVESWITLGTLLRRLDRPQTAIEAYTAALSLEPLMASAHENLADCLRELGRGDEVLDSVKASVATCPEDFRAYLLLGEALYRGGDLAGAVASYRTALELVCRDGVGEADIRQRLGDALVFAGDVAGGVAELARAVELRPWHAVSQRAMAGALLRLGEGEGALVACERALLVDAFDQEAIAIRALALYLTGRDREAREITDPERWVHITEPDFPPEINDLAAFNIRLAADLLALESRRWQPAYQSIRGGTQSGNDLFIESASTIQILRRSIEQRVAAYIESLPDSSEQPFLAGKPSRTGVRAWSVVLEDQGHHVTHIHPEGWLSGVYYVEVPEFFQVGGEAEPGCIEFGGLPWSEHPFGLVVPPLRRVSPVAGRLVLFPSYLWHGVRHFRSAGRRIAVAFDLLPLERG